MLSDSRKAVSSDLSPEALKARLTERYFTDFAGSWLSFLNSLQLNPANNIADVTDQLTLMSDVRQSPLIALMNTLAWQGQTGQKSEGLSDSIIKSAKDLVGGKDKPVIDQSASGPQGPLDETFGPLLALMGKNKGSNVMSADNSLSLQTYLTRITRVRLRLQQVASASDPQEMMQSLAQTVFQGKSVDLTDTQQYGSLIAASLGEEWSGFGSTMFLSDSLIKSAKDLVGGKDKPVIDQSASGPQGPLDETFGPLLQLLGKNTSSNVMSADNSLSLQTYLTRITRVRLRLQQVASASDPQEMMQTLAQTVFQGKSVDLTDTQQYGSLISASLGEEWSGFGNTMFVQPLTQAWETVLQPSAASLNDKWSRSVAANWHTAFDARFPFAAIKRTARLWRRR